MWSNDPSYIEDISIFKKLLKCKFPNIDCDGPLMTRHVEYLEKFEKKKQSDIPLYVQKLVNGLKGDRDHFLIASANNTFGPLTKEFHDGHITLLDEMPDEHILVALNWDFTTGALYKDSKSAGEYKDMAVVVPAAYISVADKTDPVPYFHTGGHSSATAILSATISEVRGMFPQLTRKEVRAAILRGANKNFPGYTEELHGQGMLNLIGALGEAEVIISSPNRNRPLPIPPTKNEVVGKKSPNSNRPLPALPIKKEGTHSPNSNRPLPALPVKEGRVSPI